MALPPRELPATTTCFAPVAFNTLSTSDLRKAACSAAELRPAWGLVSSSRASGSGMSIACRRARGQPLDSKRQIVVVQLDALSPLPCTNPIGGYCSNEVGADAHAASSAAAKTANRR